MVASSRWNSANSRSRNGRLNINRRNNSNSIISSMVNLISWWNSSWVRWL